MYVRVSSMTCCESFRSVSFHCSLPSHYTHPEGKISLEQIITVFAPNILVFQVHLPSAQVSNRGQNTVKLFPQRRHCLIAPGWRSVLSGSRD